MTFTTIGLDIGKRVFHVHGADAAGHTLLSKKLRRDEVLLFFRRQSACLVAMEACATGHYWAREIAALGHEVKLIPPAYVKPYVVRQKNDAADAAAICEAATRPSVRSTPVKTAEQQANRVVHRTYELLSRQRVTLINALRAHLAEFGILAPAGVQNVKLLTNRLKDPAIILPEQVRDMMNLLIDQMTALEERLHDLALIMKRRSREDADGARLMSIPGVGPITASAVLAGVPDMTRFKSARNFAAWLGLVPRQNSTGGKTRLGRISKMGDGSIRRLLVNGATSVIRWARRQHGFESSWLGQLLARKPTKVAAVALANKMARMIWAVVIKQEYYRPA